MSVEVISFKSFQKGSCIGFVDLLISKWGLEIRGCTVFQKDGKRWISMPSKTYENEMGEKKYMPYLRFSDTKVFERFQDSAKRAIDEWCLKQSEDQHFNKQVEEQQEEIPF